MFAHASFIGSNATFAKTNNTLLNFDDFKQAFKQAKTQTRSIRKRERLAQKTYRYRRVCRGTKNIKRCIGDTVCVKGGGRRRICAVSIKSL